jgi:hypothetical protein
MRIEATDIKLVNTLQRPISSFAKRLSKHRDVHFGRDDLENVAILRGWDRCLDRSPSSRQVLVPNCKFAQ